MLERIWGKRNPPSYTVSWWGRKLAQPLWKSVWRFLKKLKIKLPYDPSIPLLGMYLKECKLTYKRDNCTPMIIATLFTKPNYGVNLGVHQVMIVLKNVAHINSDV
jgi:hypothetical protein